MKLHVHKYVLKNRWLPPPISYKPDPTIVKTPAKKLDSLKVDIKTQPGERDSEKVAIYRPFFSQ